MPSEPNERELAEQVVAALARVYDPELGIDVVSLGLIYAVGVDVKDVSVVMTLTVPGCPMHSTIKADIEHEVRALGWVNRLDVRLTFEPPWTPDRISEDARARLGR